MNNQDAARESASAEVLQPFRERLDVLNVRLMALLAERMMVCLEVAKVKAARDIPMMQPARVRQVLDKVRVQSPELGLRPEYASAVFKLIIEETCLQEARLIEALLRKGTDS